MSRDVVFDELSTAALNTRDDFYNIQRNNLQHEMEPDIEPDESNDDSIPTAVVNKRNRYSNHHYRSLYIQHKHQKSQALLALKTPVYCAGRHVKGALQGNG